jgi:hypothetical protein
MGGVDSATAEPVSGPTEELRGWRKYLSVHPAAELFDRMSESELRELGENIKANGLISPIIALQVEGRLHILDGLNRLDAMELAGVVLNHKFLKACLNGSKNGAHAIQVIEVADPYDYVISANLHRRHLTSEQKRDLIAKVLKAKPEASNRQVAEQTKTSPTTVGKIREGLEATGDVSKVDTRTDTKGRKQPASKPKRKRKPRLPEPTAEVVNEVAARVQELIKPARPVEHRATASAEVPRLVYRRIRSGLRRRYIRLVALTQRRTLRLQGMLDCRGTVWWPSGMQGQYRFGS